MIVGADIVMCDNMNVKSIAQVAQIRAQKFPHILLEASGNIIIKISQNTQNLA